LVRDLGRPLCVLAFAAGLLAPLPADAHWPGRRVALGWKKIQTKVGGVLKRTSVEVSLGLTFAPVKAANQSIAASFWTGDREFWKNRSKYEDKLVNKRLSVGTLFGYANYSTSSGLNIAVGPPWVSGYFTPSGRAYGITLGIPNIMSLGVGEVRSTKDTEYARGPYLGVTRGFGLRGAFKLSVGFTLYSPIFAPITKPLEKPAQALKRFNDKTRQKLGRLKDGAIAQIRRFLRLRSAQKPVDPIDRAAELDDGRHEPARGRPHPLVAGDDVRDAR
jgi:hypothetical protein